MQSWIDMLDKRGMVCSSILQDRKSLRTKLYIDIHHVLLDVR